MDMKKKISTTKISEAWANSMAEKWAETCENFFVPSMVNLTPPTKKLELAWEKRLQEEKRRAKKITMTVGELEDMLEEAGNDYD